MTVNYAILPSRIKAAVIDGVAVIAAMYAVSEILALFESVPTYMRIAAFIVIFVVYDPFFTSVFGGTIGHSYSKITVRKESDLKKHISFPAAVIRFILKALLGWLSLLTVTGDAKKKAIHDIAVKSVVVEANI